VIDAVRLPDDALDGLPDFAFTPAYREVAGLRLAHLDEGAGPPVVMWHGEPTWSFLWRKVLPSVRDAGFRVIVPDLVGFGRSDKPTDPAWYSYDLHVEMAATLLEDLDLRDATFVVHDWGGPIGLRLAVEHPDRVSRLVMMDTGLFNGRQDMGAAWHAFRAFAERTEDLPTGFLVARGVVEPLAEAVIAAYDRPFPDAASKAGARAFPALIPLTPTSPGAEAGARAIAALRADRRPKLVLWGAQDPVLPLERGRAFAAAIGAGDVEPVQGAGHYLQEDRGAAIGARIADWLTAGA
jgi:haloalkane dehalogenase